MCLQGLKINAWKKGEVVGESEQVLKTDVVATVQDSHDEAEQPLACEENSYT